jgi:predicted AlkP superfamily pyrophosphatase or phosphodiesterase
MRLADPICALALSLLSAGAAAAAPVLMISIDGLRPGDVLEASARGVTAPTLQQMLKDGVYAKGVRNALPTVTYPNHTTLVTGVWPSVHGVSNNTTFDPQSKNYGGWYWYAADIKVPTLWDAVHASGRTTASLGWPVTVGARAIDYNIPEYWRARTADDLKLDRALSTPGLPEAVAEQAHMPLADVINMGDTTIEEDEAKARTAAAIYALKHPDFFTVHISSLDHMEHLYGPGTPKANATLTRIDTALAALIAAARKAEPDLVVVIVSDHGFAPVQHDVNLQSAFVEAGLITVDATGKVSAWDAMPWSAGGSAAVVLAHPEDAAVGAKTAALLERLSNDPTTGVGRVVSRAEIAKMGGTPEADFFVDAKIGYQFSNKLTGPLVEGGSVRGTHGYFPEHPEMRATFIAVGPSIHARGSLGEIDMRDIAPTVAELLRVPLPSAAGHALPLEKAD